MKKRLLCILLTLCLATLSACAGSGETDESASDMTNTGDAAGNTEPFASDNTTGSDSGESALNNSETPNENADLENIGDDIVSDAQIEWQTYTIEITDNQGYKIKETITISPFIKDEDTVLTSKAWSDLGRTDEIPSPNEFGYIDLGNGICQIKKSLAGYNVWNNGGGYAYSFCNVILENVTGGDFHFTADNPYKTSLPLYLFIDSEEPEEYGLDKLDNVASIKLLGSSSYYRPNGYPDILTMTADKGSIDFIIAIPEQYSPDRLFGNADTENLILRFGLHVSDSTDDSVDIRIGKTY